MTTHLELKNIADHLANALEELRLAKHAADESGDEDAETLGELVEVVEGMIEDIEAEMGEA